MSFIKYFFCFLSLFTCVSTASTSSEWAVWRSDFPEPYKSVHYSLARLEMEEWKKSPNKDVEKKNISLCQLAIYKTSGECMIFPENCLPVFISGYIPNIDLAGNIHFENSVVLREEMKKGEADIRTIKREIIKKIIDYRTTLLKDPATRAKSQQLTANHDEFDRTLKSAKEVLENSQNEEERALLEELDPLEDTLRQKQQNTLRLKAKIAEVEDEVSSFDFLSREDALNQVFDAEQRMVPYIEWWFNQLREKFNHDWEEVNCKGPNDIKHIVLHIHTRLDMCPFCLYKAHTKLIEWQGKLMPFFNRPILVGMVSSRNEYYLGFHNLSSLSNQIIFPTYTGTMRSICLDDRSHECLNEEDTENVKNNSQLILAPLNFAILYRSPTVKVLESNKLPPSSEKPSLNLPQGVACFLSNSPMDIEEEDDEEVQSALEASRLTEEEREDENYQRKVNSAGGSNEIIK